MVEIEPPVKLDNSSNEPSRDYVLNQANQSDFDYPQVGALSRIAPPNFL